MTNADQPPAITVNPGAALKNIRTEKGWTLSDVSKLTNFPVSTLSKIENGKTELTVEKLVRITLALGVNMADLFGSPPPSQEARESSRRRSITLAGAGKTVPSRNGDYSYLAVDLLEKQITPIIGHITAKSLEEFGGFHRHTGEEFVYVLEGELILHTDTYGPTHLKVGDSIYFDSSMGHAYVAAGDQPCRILSVFSTLEADALSPVHSTPPPLTIASSAPQSATAKKK
jgi:transcriptional regulator with XRE-family HTH domain